MAPHTAVYLKNEIIAQQLLDHKADVTLKDRDGKTPLDYARIRGNEGMLQLMQEYASWYLLKLRLWFSTSEGFVSSQIVWLRYKIYFPLFS